MLQQLSLYWKQLPFQMYGSQPHLLMGSSDQFGTKARANTSLGLIAQPEQQSAVQTGQNHLGPFANDMFNSNPTMLLHQHNLCKQDNKDRLKDCKNLSDLVNFKVKTIADQFQTENNKDLNTDGSVNALKKMCDPLLANRYFHKLMSKKEYEMPKDWEKNPYENKLPKIQSKMALNSVDKASSRNITHNVSTQDEDAQDEMSETFRRKKQKFLKEQEDLEQTSKLMKSQHQQSLISQEDRLRKSVNDRHQDPVKMLKGFFDAKEEEKMSQHKKRKSRSEMGHYSGHPNYIIAKYTKMKESGMLDKLDKQIEQRNSQAELMNQYDQFLKLQRLNQEMANNNMYGPFGGLKQPLLNQKSSIEFNIQEGQPVQKMKADLKQIFKEDVDDAQYFNEQPMASAQNPDDLLDKVDQMLQNPRAFPPQDEYQAPIDQRIDRAILMPKSKKPVTIEENPFGELKPPLAMVEQNSMPYNPPEIPGGMIHSQLTKYQNVSTNLQNKGYVQYSQKQIELANRLKEMQAHQHKQSKSKNKDFTAKLVQRQLQQQAIKQKKMSKMLEQESIGSMNINLRGSLPQIKNELERGKRAPALGTKSFYEDNNSVRIQEMGNNGIYAINSDYAMSHYVAKPAKSAGQNRRGKVTFQKKSQIGNDTSMKTSAASPGRITGQAINKGYQNPHYGSDYNNQISAIQARGIQVSKSSYPSDNLSFKENTATNDDNIQTQFARTEGFAKIMDEKNKKVVEEGPNAVRSDMVTVRCNKNAEFNAAEKDASQVSVKDSTNQDQTLRGSTQQDPNTVRASNQDHSQPVHDSNNLNTEQGEDKPGRISIYSSQQHTQSNQKLQEEKENPSIRSKGRNQNSIVIKSNITGKTENPDMTPIEKTDGLGETEYILFQPKDNGKPVLMELIEDEKLTEKIDDTQTANVSPLPDITQREKDNFAKNISQLLNEHNEVKLEKNFSKKSFVHSQMIRKKKVEDLEKGYFSNIEPQMDATSNEMYEQIIHEHLIRRGCWIPSRFKKFPRFTIFTQKDLSQDKIHLINQYISLNPEVLALLASSDMTNLNQLSSVLAEPAVTNTSIMEKKSPSPTRKSPVREDNTKINQRSSPHSAFLESLQNESQKQSQKQMNDTKNLTSNLTKEINQDVFELVKEPLVDVKNNNENVISIPDIPESLDNSQIKQFDPFDKILLTKGIDNQILTSFRTLSKSNNMISNTLKVVHRRFQGQKQKPNKNQLYELNKDVYDPTNISLEHMTQEERDEFASYFAMISAVKQTNTSPERSVDGALKQWVIEENMSPEYMTNFRISNQSGFNKEEKVKIPLINVGMKSGDLTAEALTSKENQMTSKDHATKNVERMNTHEMNQTFSIIGKNRKSIDSENYHSNTDRKQMIINGNQPIVEDSKNTQSNGGDDWQIQEKMIAEVEIIKKTRNMIPKDSYIDSEPGSTKKHVAPLINTQYGSMLGSDGINSVMKNQSTDMVITDPAVKIKSNITPIDQAAAPWETNIIPSWSKESITEPQLPQVILKKPSQKFTGGFSKMHAAKKKSPRRSTSEQPKVQSLKQDDIKELMELLTQQKISTSVEDIKKMISGFSASKAQQFMTGKNDKHQIKKLIDEIYSKEKKYERKMVEREDFVNSKNLIFDLSKVNELDSIIEKPIAPKPPAKKVIKMSTKSPKPLHKKPTVNFTQLTSVAPPQADQAVIKTEPIDFGTKIQNSVAQSIEISEKRNFIVGMQIEVNNKQN